MAAIYVEIPINTSIQEIWRYTQDPELHQQWDLRFTTIDYLPKATESEPQRFRYSTNIGFGLNIAGEGESTGTVSSTSGERSSALKFWSHAPLSLIDHGSGYWKYIPTDHGVTFLTWYAYQVRFGVVGQLVDRLLFRPLMGWATAWSFDALRLWLEQGIHPSQSLRGFLIQTVAQMTLALLWIYQGLVPKLLFPDSGELAILSASGLLPGVEAEVLA